MCKAGADRATQASCLVGCCTKPHARHMVSGNFQLTQKVGQKAELTYQRLAMNLVW
jgi:hypothetical protein